MNTDTESSPEYDGMMFRDYYQAKAMEAYVSALANKDTSAYTTAPKVEYKIATEKYKNES